MFQTEINPSLSIELVGNNTPPPPHPAPPTENLKRNPRSAHTSTATAETWILQRRNLQGQKQATSRIKKSAAYEWVGGR